MSYNWCHGPECHTNKTQDRIRGTKGSKVLRTRKIKETKWNANTFWRFFCSNGCYNDFANKYAREVIAIAPRNEALETPITDPKKETHTHEYGNGYTHTYVTTEYDVIENNS